MTDAAPTRRPRRRFGSRWIWAIAALGAMLAVLGPGPANAHAGFESSMPAASMVPAPSPPVTSLSFDEDIDLSPTSMLSSDASSVRAAASVGRALGVARFSAFVGVTVLLGGLFMVMSVADTAEIGWPARRLLWIGWALLLVGALANFGLLGANAAAGSIGDTLNSSLWGEIADTRTGSLLLARLALLAMMFGVLIAVARHQRLWWRSAVSMLGVLMIFTFSGGGHPGMESPQLVGMSLDALHLSLIALWLGSLAMMAVGGRIWLRDDSHTVAVQSFSRMARVAVPLIVVTGVLQAWRLSGGFDTLTDTTWGRVLLAKGTLVVLVVTIGAVSRWLLDNDGPAALRRTIVTETLLGVAVLGLAAAMVGVSP